MLVINLSIKNESISVINSTLINSHIIIGSSNIQISTKEIFYNPIYRKTLNITNIYVSESGTYFGYPFLKGNVSYNLYNVLIELPSKQEIFLSEYQFNKSVYIGVCNEDISDCYIFTKYRPENYKNIDPCSKIFISDFISPQNVELWPKFFKEPPACFEEV